MSEDVPYKKIESNIRQKELKILIPLLISSVIVSIVLISTDPDLYGTCTNCIGAVYDCPGNNTTCYFYNNETQTIRYSIESIKINGEKASKDNYQQYEEPGEKSLIIQISSSLNTLDNFFLNNEYLKKVDFSHFEDSIVQSMSGTFKGCKRLESVNWGDNFKTSKVKNMDYLFDGCSNITTINLNIDTKKVIFFNNMFSNCKNVTKIEFKNLDFSYAYNMNSMFLNCEKITSIDLSSFNTTKVNYMNNMFSNCKSLKEINLKNLNTSAVSSMEEMFSGCDSLYSLDLSNFDPYYLINTKNMFANCTKLSEINLKNIVGRYLYDMSGMFSGCSSLVNIDLSSLDTKSCPNTDDTFDGLPAEGIFKCNSSRISENILSNLTSKNWTIRELRE